MKLMVLIVSYFWKPTSSLSFSDAIAEGIKDMFREMGYAPKRERDV